jgi:glycosyltransferase involved in cell wall biosynthesis
VVEYFTRFYLRGRVAPERAARWCRYGWLPDWLKLVFHKQADGVRHAARLIVPSAPMAERIRRCYPDCPAGKIVVIPWGNLAPPAPPGPLPVTVAEDEVVIVTLSRLSPEKGIERLLAVEPLLRGRFVIWICGAAAYMQGRRYERKLRRLAGPRVRFLGHLTGPVKAAVLQRADILVSASRHESYGLSIAEAQAAGCRILSHAHYGAAGTVINCADARQLADTLNRMIAEGRTRKESCRPTGSTAARQLADLLAAI